jgi:hypothetical protein
MARLGDSGPERRVLLLSRLFGQLDHVCAAGLCNRDCQMTGPRVTLFGFIFVLVVSPYQLGRAASRGIAGCCACAASDQDTAAPPRIVMNSSRLIPPPRFKTRDRSCSDEAR